MSLEEILQLEPSKLESIVFSSIPKERYIQNQDQNINPLTADKYVQFKSKEFYSNGKKFKMI